MAKARLERAEAAARAELALVKAELSLAKGRAGNARNLCRISKDVAAIDDDLKKIALKCGNGDETPSTGDDTPSTACTNVDVAGPFSSFRKLNEDVDGLIQEIGEFHKKRSALLFLGAGLRAEELCDTNKVSSGAKRSACPSMSSLKSTERYL